MDREEEGEACLPCCSTLELCPTSPGTSLDIATRSLAAFTPRDSVWPWSKYKELRVRFMNATFLEEKGWTVGNGQRMNTFNILAWANIWSERGGGEIPKFVEARPGEQAEIRVLFNDRGHCNSKVGTKAQSVDADKPTMNLDLQTNCNTSYKQHLVIHEFGHALGLGHEHQRSTFWSDIRPFIDQDRMKRYFRRCMRGLSDRDFESHWEHNYAEDICSELGQKTEYDPDSIMHYWFRKEWLRPPYNDRDYVTQCQLVQSLTDRQANALLGVHKRDGTLADEPSALDIQLMREVYGGGGDERDGPCRLRTDFSAGGGGMEMDSPLSLTSLGGMSNFGRGSSIGGMSSFGRGSSVGGGSSIGGMSNFGRGSSIGGASSIGGNSSFGRGSSHSDSGLSLQSLSGAGNPNDMTDWYDGEVENHHMTRIEYMDENSKEKVLEIYDQAACQWKKIGEILGLEEGALTSIDRNSYDDRDKVTKVLGHWMQNAGNLRNHKRYPHTWQALVKLLKKSGLEKLSRKLEHALSASVSSLRENID